MLAARWCWNVDFERDPDPVWHNIVYSRLLNFLFVPKLSSSRTDKLSLNVPHSHICHLLFSGAFFNEPLDRFHIEIHMRDYGSFELCRRKQKNKQIDSIHSQYLSGACKTHFQLAQISPLFCPQDAQNRDAIWSEFRNETCHSKLWACFLNYLLLGWPEITVFQDGYCAERRRAVRQTERERERVKRTD